MEADSMIDMPNMAFDEKIGNKRVREGEGEDEIHKGRLEKRPSGIVGEPGSEDYVEEGGANGGIIDTFISNVFHNNKSGTKDEVEVGGEVKTDAFDVVKDEAKKEDHLSVDGGGGMISDFFSNIFQNNGSANGESDQVKSDHLLDEDAEKTGCLGGGHGGDGDNGGDAEPEDLKVEKLEKLEEKKDDVVDLSSKDPKGLGLQMKPDDYSERVFFLNNN